MHIICGILLGTAIGWWACRGWAYRQRCRARARQQDQPVETNAKQVLHDVRAGLARNYRDLEATIGQIEIVLQAAPVEGARETLSQQLHDAKQALSTCLASSYDTLRKWERQEEKADIEPRLNQDRQALDQFLKERLATRARYRNPCAVAMFSIDAVTPPISPMQFFQAQVRITDRVFWINQQEFVVVLPETDLDGAQVFAQRCAVSLTDSIGAQAFAGVAAAQDSDGVRSLLNRVDAALYRAKCDETQFVFGHDGQKIEPCTVSLTACAAK